VATLQSHVIRVLGSSIIGLPEHTSGNIDDAIAHAVAHDTEFHQFMLYTPIPGTPLHAEHQARGTLLGEDECPDADAHGQLRFNFRHPQIRDGQETEFLLRAFRRDFEVNGPSLARIVRTLLRGLQAHGDDPDPRVRRRVRRECAGLGSVYAGALWAAERWLGRGAPAASRLRTTRRTLARELGWGTRVAAPVLGSLLLAAMARERRRLRRGESYEPPTFYEANHAALQDAEGGRGLRCGGFIEATTTHAQVNLAGLLRMRGRDEATAPADRGR
jgi:hypothetical protein